MKLYPKKMYKIGAGAYCGFFMPKYVMEKAAKLIHKHELAMRELLEENKSELELSHWSMSDCPNPVYIDSIIDDEKDKEFGGIDSRIRLFKVPEIKAVDELYVIENYNEAKEIANSLKVRKDNGNKTAKNS